MDRNHGLVHPGRESRDETFEINGCRAGDAGGGNGMFGQPLSVGMQQLQLVPSDRGSFGFVGVPRLLVGPVQCGDGLPDVRDWLAAWRA